jgi:hypothetical protein
MTYLTPDRFKAMGFGLDLADVEDYELRQTLARASALVDAYCAVPMLPQRHDFRGGTITGEQHDWRLADMSIGISAGSLGSRRVWANHKPIKDVTSFKVKFTNTYDVTIAPENLYIQHIEGWAEVVSIAAIVTGIYPVGINFGLYTPVAEFDYTYGYNLTATDEVLDPTDAATFRSVNNWWATTPAPVIYKNGVVQTSGYTVDYNEGTVTFDANLAATDLVTVDYTYKMPSAIGEATALVAVHLLGEADLQRKGMAGIGMLRVAEVELRREGMGRRGATTGVMDELEPEITALLAPFVFHTVR